jgi:DME family drug/metabolite transporter
MTATGTARTGTLSRIAGYCFALGAGTIWGTTGSLSTALYREGAPITGIGFWRVLLGVGGLALYAALADRSMFRIDKKGWLLVGLGGGALVALFEVPYQFGIAGAGVAGAATLLYTAPVMVAILAYPILGERITSLRLLLAIAVMIGAAMTVLGTSVDAGAAPPGTSRAVGVIGGLLAALSYAGTTLLARWAVPRYGTLRVLFLELLGGTVLLGVMLTAAGPRYAPALPPTSRAWLYIVALAIGTVLLANFFFFSAVKRIEAAPTAVAATIEPVVAAMLALLFFNQQLTMLGWLGLALVVAGVATGYWKEGAAEGAA